MPILKDLPVIWEKNFTNKLGDGGAINSLNFNKVYVITSGRSASSSELVINGLSPYINVIQVGDNTYGKNVGGPAALYDYIDNNRTKTPTTPMPFIA